MPEEITEKYRYAISGGIYGVPFQIRFIGPDGDKVVLFDKGRALHKKIMGFPKGEIRNKVIEGIYHTLPKLDEEEKVK